MKALMDTCGRMLYKPSLGLLFIRVGTGLVFLMHGWSKYGMGTEAVNGMFAGMGFPMGTGVFVMALEIIGGIALILGVLPRVFAILFTILMAVAIYATGFFANGYRQHELEILLMLLSLGIAFAGSGRWSLWAVECRSCGGMTCKDEHDQSVPAHI
ncbi:MAG: DoxX family protein [Candidatus Pacebacteria bacterium]|nr:DoxX family protein [Candidatus Paceibacterota bacterium]